MKNEVTILKVMKFASVALVTVKYCKDGVVDFSSGATEAEAMANIEKVVPVKNAEFFTIRKQSNSGRSFINNRGVMVEE